LGVPIKQQLIDLLIDCQP